MDVALRHRKLGNREHRIAGLSVKYEDHPRLRYNHRDRQVLPVLFKRNQERLGGDIIVPEIVMDNLKRPFRDSS